MFPILKVCPQLLQPTRILLWIIWPGQQKCRPLQPGRQDVSQGKWENRNVRIWLSSIVKITKISSFYVASSKSKSQPQNPTIFCRLILFSLYNFSHCKSDKPVVKTPHDLQVRFVSDKVLSSSIDDWQALLLWLWSTHLYNTWSLVNCAPPGRRCYWTIRRTNKLRAPLAWLPVRTGRRKFQWTAVRSPSTSLSISKRN